MTIPNGNACFAMICIFHLRLNSCKNVPQHYEKAFLLGVFIDMSRGLKTISQGISLFTIGGIGYVIIENIWRGYSHITMFFAGGLSFLCIEIMDVRLGKSVNTFGKCILGSTIITTIEFVFGCVFNLYYKMNVWDYSHLPFNLFGQISLVFSSLWCLLTYPVLYLGKSIRRGLFKEGKKRLASPEYHTLQM